MNAMEDLHSRIFFQIGEPRMSTEHLYDRYQVVDGVAIPIHRSEN
jgi:hypothetical protein